MSDSGPTPPKMTFWDKVSLLFTLRQRREGIVILFLTVFGVFLEMLGVGLVFPLIAMMGDQTFVEGLRVSSSWGWLLKPYTPTELMMISTIGFASIFLAKSLFLTYLIRKRSKFAFGVASSLSTRLFASHIAQPYSAHMARNSSSVINLIIAEVGIFTNFVLLSVIQLTTEALVVLGLVGVLVWYQPLGTLIVVLFALSLGSTFYARNKNRLSEWGSLRRYHEQQRTQHVQQGMMGIKEVILSGHEDVFVDKYRLHAERSAYVNYRQTSVVKVVPIWLEFFGVVTLAGLIAYLLWAGKEASSIVPTVGLFGAAAFRIMPSANRIITSLQQLRYGTSTVEGIMNGLDSEPAEPPDKVSSMPAPNWSEIRVTDLCYRYIGKDVPALQSISLAIPRGSMIGLVGPSGSGKSTLINVVLGLLSPTSGVVSLDKTNIHDCMRAWHAQIGYVPQSIYLSDDTLLQNIAFGLPEDAIDVAAAREALRTAQLDAFVATLPDGLDTMVGESGVRLSGGQKQRLGIARALYKRPSVLILDEGTSALDNATERELMDALLTLRGEITMLLVAHRLSTLEHCHQIYKLEHGQLS